MRAWQRVQHKPITVSPDTPVSEVAALMIERKIHHVVVIDSEGITGVVLVVGLRAEIVPSTTDVSPGRGADVRVETTGIGIARRDALRAADLNTGYLIRDWRPRERWSQCLRETR